MQGSVMFAVVKGWFEKQGGEMTGYGGLKNYSAG